MARNRAPYLPSVLCCGALEPWPWSQYSPPPSEFALKKSLNSISDRKANLSRLRSVLRPPENTLVDCFSAAERAFFGFSKALAQLLLPALKADRSDEICGTKKGATSERRS
ncbi:hypothetical protein [Pseudomonas fluorescens]|uniref:hypothetical protein n=1 Tax=Pseudomonas fluorescens TaxID=294 RepID=UPI0012698DD3|nr:hypothetical protein [Pseudomonas fluorescens]